MGKRILVIDDDAAMLMAVSKVLHHGGAIVQSAASVAEAIALLEVKNQPFDAVLTDLRMPVTSGKMILSLMKSTRPKVPVIIMSAYWTEEAKAECTQLGANKFLDKPLHSWQLLASVAKELAHSPQGGP